MSDDPNTAARRAAVAETIARIRGHLDAHVDVEALEAAKAELLALCERRDLFDFDAFPLPQDGSNEITYLIHCEPDGRYALYVNSGMPAQTYRPHNHGGAWAIIAGVEGEEDHDLYTETGDPAAPLRKSATLPVAPGKAVSMLPDGIHAIRASGGDPLLHLHLYAYPFESQGDRTEWDPDTHAPVTFKLEDVGILIDAR
jgi:predicted metal-dependent enzyme (double-stranded beta helix superfamily)